MVKERESEQSQVPDGRLSFEVCIENSLKERSYLPGPVKPTYRPPPGIGAYRHLTRGCRILYVNVARETGAM